MSRPALLAVAALLGAGCGGASAAEMTAEQFGAPEAEVARERAPDVFAAAERAREEAEAAQRRGDEAAAQDHGTRARLLLSAAIAESDRIALEDQRLELERRAAELEEQAARDVHARLEIQTEMSRRASARVAAREAALAFEQAADDEARRYGARADERARMHREAADILLQRARLLYSAAEAMGAPQRRVTRVVDGIEEAERIADPARRLGAAQEAFYEALAAIGEARAGREGPTRDEIAALVAQAEEMGLDVQQRDRGLTVVLDGAFAGRGAQLRPAARTELEKVAALLEAHPHGPVQVHGFGLGRGAQRVADARAGAVVEALGRHGIELRRLEPVGVVDVQRTDAGSAEVVLNAYGAVDRRVSSAPPERDEAGGEAAQPR